MFIYDRSTHRTFQASKECIHLQAERTTLLRIANSIYYHEDATGEYTMISRVTACLPLRKAVLAAHSASSKHHHRFITNAVSAARIQQEKVGTETTSSVTREQKGTGSPRQDEAQYLPSFMPRPKRTARTRPPLTSI